MALSLPVQAGDHRQGPADAPVALVEYGDYQCPYCGQADTVVKEVRRQFGDRLCFVFRNMPLTNMHPMAELAAEAAESAALQGRFWEMHDILYENQERLGPQMIEEAAVRLGLDIVRFNDDVNTRKTLERVRHDVETAIKSGVQGTPSFFVNGQPVQDWSLAGLTRAIEAALR
ncbi:DsbA family protein [Tropicimonas sp.]|uniref:DsbA family protein n=1 Tax=Tropicimonas sp. TaxID=2067044 RepID=UPI003A8579F8